jgi:hypothetical protein
MPRIGLNCKLYRNTASYAAPTWVEITGARDVTVPMSKGEAETSTRGSTWKYRKGTLKDVSIDFQLLMEPGDAGFAALLASYTDGTDLELLVLNGAITDVDAEGLRARVEVFSFQDAQPLEGVQAFDVSCKPVYSTNPPTWFKVPGGT